MSAALSPWSVIIGCYALAFLLLIGQSFVNLRKLKKTERQFRKIEKKHEA